MPSISVTYEITAQQSIDISDEEFEEWKRTGDVMQNITVNLRDDPDQINEIEITSLVDNGTDKEINI